MIDFLLLILIDFLCIVLIAVVFIGFLALVMKVQKDIYDNNYISFKEWIKDFWEIYKNIVKI